MSHSQDRLKQLEGIEKVIVYIYINVSNLFSVSYTPNIKPRFGNQWFIKGNQLMVRCWRTRANHIQPGHK